VEIYKYRAFSDPTDDDYRRLADLVHRNLVWCARSDTLNDPREFIWRCEYTTTTETIDLLTEVLVLARGRTHADARHLAEIAINTGRLDNIARPVIDGMIQQCRDEIGLSCFGGTPTNAILWQRYAARSAGVCIEYQVPDDLLKTQLHRVQYAQEKHLHIDQILRAYVDGAFAQDVYDLALLTKPIEWADEEEIRFVSRGHSIAVAIDRAKTIRVILGSALRPDVLRTIAELASPVPTEAHGN